MIVKRARRSSDGWNWSLVTALGAILFSLLWALLIITVEQVHLLLYSPNVKLGTEIILALSNLFGALVLTLFPNEGARQRLHWVAGGFVVLGSGSLIFGYFLPLLTDTPSPSAALYGSLITRSVAAALFALGLLPSAPRPFSKRIGWAIGTAFAAGCALALFISERLPVLVRGDLDAAAAALRRGILPGLDDWYWPLAAIPLVLTLAAVVGAVRHFPGRATGLWLVVAMALLAGSQVHALFWPSGFSPIVTSSTVLRLAFVAVVFIGATLELKRISADRDAALHVTREAARQATDLVRRKSDISHMVAHELSSPLAAISRMADIVATGPLQLVQEQGLQGIQEQVRAIGALIDDVRFSAMIEEDSFIVQRRPVPCSQLLSNATAFAHSLSDGHQLTVNSTVPEDVRVLADPDRIDQILRNLLQNAAQYSPAGSPIELRAELRDGHVRFAVSDHGIGIDPADLRRIFEKFERGRGRSIGQVTGMGVGLYLARRLVAAHESSLGVQSTRGTGSTFWFTLVTVDNE